MSIQETTALPVLFMIASGAGLRGAYFGIVTTHFVIDAKVWRLREPAQRKIIGERFGFLLNRG